MGGGRVENICRGDLSFQGFELVAGDHVGVSDAPVSLYTFPSLSRMNTG